MYESVKSQIIDTALKMKEYGIVVLSTGNVSVRMENGDILVTPSGIYYEEMVERDILVMDIEGRIVEGKRKPSVDTGVLLFIYKNCPGVNSIIHTHQVYATAAGLIGDVLPAAVTTLVNAASGSVNVAEFTSPASMDMGIKAVKYLKGRRAVIFKNHGVIAVGENLKQALNTSIYLEEGAKAYLLAKMAGNPSVLTEGQVKRSLEAFKNCGQESEYGH